jgi:hypothetical protein
MQRRKPPVARRNYGNGNVGGLLARDAQTFLLQRIAQPDPVLAYARDRPVAAAVVPEHRALWRKATVCDRMQRA